jgi:transposase
METKFKPVDRDQQFLLPPSMRDWLPPGDLAYFLIDVVAELDLAAIYRHYQLQEIDGQLTLKANSGQPPFHPQMMTTLLLYAYCLGTPSSRRIARLCERDAGYRVVSAGQQPDFRTISEFRRIHLAALQQLFVQVLQIADQAGLIKLGHVALDGTKIKANASKHKAMSYARLCDKEQHYAATVQTLLAQATVTDAHEDRQHGCHRRGDELPHELQFAQQRLAKIRAAKAALEQQARAAAPTAAPLPEDGPPNPPTRGRPRKVAAGTPPAKQQYNFTDPESRLMKMGDGAFDQAYNCQAAVDSHAQIIVAAAAVAAPNDKQQVRPMTAQMQQNLGTVPDQLSADAGYYSADNVIYLRAQGIDDYLCPDRLQHGQSPPPVRGRMPKGLPLIDRVRRKLRTRSGRAIYGLRKQLPEPVFGRMKRGRGLRQFLLRGRAKVNGEWLLWCTGHNLLKLWNAAVH